MGGVDVYVDDVRVGLLYKVFDVGLVLLKLFEDDSGRCF